MKFKIVPPARGLETLWTARAALPLVPDDEESCCIRVMRDADVPSQDEAKEWLTFLHALGLAESTDTGYRRTRGDLDAVTLEARFRERIYGADDVLEFVAGAEQSLAVDEAFERFTVPEWERQRQPEWETVWREHVKRILEWAVALGLAERTASGYC